MFGLNKTKEVEELIAVTKSDSGISGPELAKAHIRLGELLAENIDIEPEDTTVVAMLRGGIFLHREFILNWDVNLRYMIQSRVSLSAQLLKM